MRIATVDRAGHPIQNTWHGDDMEFDVVTQCSRRYYYCLYSYECSLYQLDSLSFS